MLRYTIPIVIAIVLFTIGNAVFALPPGWSSLGCWTDTGDRLGTLTAASYFDPVYNTIENCIQFCDERNYPFAGVEYGRECCAYMYYPFRGITEIVELRRNLDCDTSLHRNSTQSALTNCNFPCPNNTAEICGGSAMLSLFTKANGPALVNQFSDGLAGVWNLVGTFNNTTPNSQPFVVEAVIAGTATTSGSVENCLTWCTVDLGCSLCSISDGGVCECGNTLSPNRITAAPGTALCSLNSTEICGDHGIWQVYEFTPTAT